MMITTVMQQQDQKQQKHIQRWHCKKTKNYCSRTMS